MPKDDDLPAPPRGGRGIRIALAVSVALNLAVAGAVVGALLHGPPMPLTAVRDLGFGLFASALTEDDRRALREAFIARKPDIREARRAMHEDLAAVAAALRADPFRPEVLRAAMDRGAARTLDLLKVGQSLLFDHVVAMTPDERLAMADRLDEALRRRGPGGRDGDREDRPAMP